MELLIHHDKKLNNSFQRTIVHQEKVSKIRAPSEQPQKGSIYKYFNNNTDTTISALTKIKLDYHKPKISPFRFEDP